MRHNPAESNGESGKRQGDLFAKYCRTFVKLLQYGEIFSEKDDIDLLAIPPIGFPKSDLLKPCISPDAETAFQFTSGKISEPYIDKAERIIVKFNNKKKEKIKAEGGIIVCDSKIAQSLYKYCRGKTNLFIWDIRDVLFLLNKSIQQKFLSKLSSTYERSLDKYITYLWCLVGKNEAGIFTAKACLFFHEQNKNLTSNYIDKAMAKLTDKVKNLAVESGSFPLQVELSVYTRGLITLDVDNKINEILKNYSKDEEKLVYTLREMVVFQTAPWCSFLRIDELLG